MKHLHSVRIDVDFLGEIGLVPFTAKEARASLETFRSDLDQRVLSRLKPAMSSAQRHEFESLWQGNSDREVDLFLDRHLPGHRQVAAEELAKLKAELRACATIDRVLADVSPFIHDAFARLDADSKKTAGEEGA